VVSSWVARWVEIGGWGEAKSGLKVASAVFGDLGWRKKNVRFFCTRLEIGIHYIQTNSKERLSFVSSQTGRRSTFPGLQGFCFKIMDILYFSRHSVLSFHSNSE
jgi:hypothetical protein